MKSKRKIIIGLDGVPYDLLKDLSEKGVMPNVKSIIEKGVFKKINSSIPEVSSVAWSSIITGADPAQHGIFGFTDIVEGTYRINFPNFQDLNKEPFWDAAGLKSVIINVPGTYPVRKMNGIHISGFISVALSRSVYPESLIPELERDGYRLDVDSAKAHESMELFLRDMRETHEGLVKVYDRLWTSCDWDVFMLVFTTTDRLMHFLFDAYKDKSHAYHDDFMEHFRDVDVEIGKVLGRLRDDDLVIILSDHGFEELKNSVNLNFLLEENGFLKFRDGKRALAGIGPLTKAFVMDPGRVYLNYEDKYPSGSVAREEASKLLGELEDLFGSVESGGKKVIKRFHRKEEIYTGPLLDKAPDLVMMSGEGFDLKAGVNSNKAFERTVFSGKHTYEGAFLLLNDPGYAEKVSGITDVIKTGGLIMDLLKER